MNRLLCTVLLSLSIAAAVLGRDLKDTLFSAAGDRVILSYSVTQSGGQMTVKFSGVQKKLSQRNLEKYRKLDEIAVVFFDRTGAFDDMTFEGMATNAFMVPADMQYSTSSDGYFLLQDNPTLQFTATANAELSIPLYLAHYKKKQHYDVFGMVGPLTISAKGGAAGTGRQQGGGSEVIMSEELVDEGMSPADEALIRMDMLRGMMESATKVTEELTHEAAMLRDLSVKITDQGVRKQVTDLLKLYDQKKQELEGQAEAQQKAEAAAQAQAAQEQQHAMLARQDSIQAAQEQKAAEDKKDMMWLIGGIAGIGLLLMVGKQVFQTMKNNKLQKTMMDNLSKAQQQTMNSINIPGAENNPLLNSLNNEVKREARKTMTKEGEAAKERLQALRKGNTKGNTPGQGGPVAQEGASAQQPKAAAQPKKPSLNDVIPKNYKRWRKPGQPDNNNVTI